MPSPSGGPDIDAWRAFCSALADAGEHILGADFPSSTTRERAEGFRHLADQAACWLGWSVGNPPGRDPAFYRLNDLFTKWGGPNVDNCYRHARIASDGTYRITGHMHSCEEFLLAVRIDNMHQEPHGTLCETSATDLGIREDQPFSLVVGNSPGADLPIPDGAQMIAVREYYYDWRPLDPATLTIERLDRTPGAGSPTEDEIARWLAEATSQFQNSLRVWNDYMRHRRAEHPANQFITPRREAGGVVALRYAFCFFDLGPDDALVVESAIPDARYWSFQLYNLGWFESLDVANRVTSLNHTQARPGTDGRVTIAAAAKDPGVHNWLDTEGRAAGLMTFRVGWGEEMPAPSARVVPLSHVADAVPAGTPMIDPAGRARQIHRRQEHMRWRFRP